MSDLVSIITPCYNAEKYIKDTIESVLNQDYYNWELIIIDDCSSDNSKLIVEEYMKIDKRIKLISLDRNSGVAVARNTGINAANGRFIAFLDSDDLWYSNKLSKQVYFMKKNNYYFTHTGYELINNEGVRLNKVIRIPEELNYEEMLKGNSIGCLTVMLDRSVLKKIEMPNIKHEDYATWLDITKSGIIAHGLDENLALYRKSKNSLSSNKLKAALWTWNIFRNRQKLSFIKSIKCFSLYIVRSLKKHFNYLDFVQTK
ncbi:glycosyltransferase family 2 protein [Lutispora thermophila]|uniref:Glycosyltransferase involved in cell wall bisynthesis n=1 Tax=Lutispora thermophila DSM 19022 TaxID=1122184 RepID=A0A1M6BX67_9FIRM|nr:glycosyltransferase family 2 protein [Lutispora thermophila]SHI53241.1 Glycosyltransferase involved in cell wall bisynthesis [Lutispora thermophila DSM 19022]